MYYVTNICIFLFLDYTTPLSAAAKQRRYRERLKAEKPQKYEEQKIKNLERMKAKRKKISEMNTKEKEVQRSKWRTYQRNRDVKKSILDRKSIIYLPTYRY